MKYPILNEVAVSKEMTNTFGGYVHKDTINEGEFYDTKNITTEFFPLIASRHKRGILKTFTNLQGIIDKDTLAWVDNGQLYINNVQKALATGVTLSTTGGKQLCKMGAYIVIFPDKVWYNTKDDTSGYMDAIKTYNQATNVTFSMVKSDGTNITLWSGTGTPPDGAYKIDVVDGKASLKVYSAITSMWVNVATTYMKISVSGIGAQFSKGDGVKITADFTGVSWPRANDIFVNDEGNGKRSSNFAIFDQGNDYITVTGLLDVATKAVQVLSMSVERKAPDIAYVCECQNRLWACSQDGHEIYCCKLGDVKNWNLFAGISTDSWAATVGSDGVFTGAFAYLGYPIFFKEHSLLKVSISAYGAHSYREIECRGVEEGSEKSLTLLNELLYYKSSSGVCVYDGNFPQLISDSLGEVRYSDAVSGSIKDRYYIAMKDEKNQSSLFVYDATRSLWAKEDNLGISFFCRNDDDLYFVSDNRLYSVYGTQLYGTGEEKAVDWLLESGNIGYYLPGNKYLGRLNLRLSLEFGAHVSVYVNYDSSNVWDFAFNLSGKGTQSFTVPIRPKRCDHFRYRLVGHGGAKLIALTKEYEEGSDI